MNVRTGRVFLIAFMLAATGCSGGGTTGTGLAGTPCPALAFPVPTLITPANGAVNVATSLGTVHVAGHVSAQVAITLAPPSGPSLTQTDTASYGSNTNDTALGVPALAAQTTYTVFLTDLGPCPFLKNTAIGSFTTR